MPKLHQRDKELRIIVLFASVAVVLVIVLSAIGMYHMSVMHDGTEVHFLILFFLMVFLGFFTYGYLLLKKYSQNITQKENELVETNTRLEYAINGAGDGLWDWNLVTGELYLAARWKQMLGYEPHELASEFASWEENVHPDDLEYAKLAIIQAHTKQVSKYNITYRMRHKDGTWVWILDRGQTLFNEDGEAIRMIGFHTDVTENRRLQDELKTSQELFEQFMEYMPANIAILEDDAIVYANKAMNTFFQKDTIVGATFDHLLSKRELLKIRKLFTKGLENGSNEEVLKIHNFLNEEKMYRAYTFRIQTQENTKVGLVSIDITKEYQNNQDVKKVLSAFERSNISVLMTDLEGNIEYVNPSWCSITGYTKEELLGKNPRIVKSGYVSDASYVKMWNELTSGKVWNSEIKNLAKDGAQFWEDTTIMPSFDNNGTINGYVSFKVEINEKVQLKQKIQEQNEMMIAQSRHAAMGEMISMIAHQWRQPISVIAMHAANILADIELETLDNESLQETSQSIIEQTQELSKTIDDFRDFFKPEKIAENISIANVIEDAVHVIGKSLENNNITIRVENFPSLHLTTYARELMHVFINIIKNAKEALEVSNQEDKTISIKVKELEERIIVEIFDNAGGIKNDIINKIFDPYFTTKGVKNGTGLGLYMSKTIIEKHLHGEISAYNHDKGACFKLSLPVGLEHE